LVHGYVLEKLLGDGLEGWDLVLCEKFLQLQVLLSQKVEEGFKVSEHLKASYFHWLSGPLSIYSACFYKINPYSLSFLSLRLSFSIYQLIIPNFFQLILQLNKFHPCLDIIRSLTQALRQLFVPCLELFLDL
jgi:hypothetical protein